MIKDMQEVPNRSSRALMVNVGCGSVHHPDWTNLDIVASDGVQYHDIKNPLPFEDATVDVLYHSHVLEHLTKAEGERFMRDCHRALRPGGTVRIVIPDLEALAREYLKNLEAAFDSRSGDAMKDYTWNMLELFDQVVRTESGGQMPAAIASGAVRKEYVLFRTGDETAPLFDLPVAPKKRNLLKRLYKKLRPRHYNPQFSGEAHRWMYDRLSMRELLERIGFAGFTIQGFNTSRIPDWNRYRLDESVAGSSPRKPDSLFVEAVK